MADGEQVDEGHNDSSGANLMPGAHITTVLPGALQEEALRTTILTAMNTVAREATTELRHTVKTWDHKVQFKTKRRFPRRGNVIGFEISTDDEIWNMLDQGTTVRFSELSDNWESKTAPDVLDSYPGAGEVIGVNQEGFKPGIEARRWTEAIGEFIENRLGPDVGEAIEDWLANNGWTF